ncbi:MAG: apolipoprotein N-acyltransferase [Candidatus Omnitrophota bacterium]
MARKINHVILAFFSGLLLSVSFPGLNVSLAAYLSFVPLFFALKNLTKREAFFVSYLAGFTFFLITMFWMRYVSILGGLLLISILSVFFGLFGLYFLYAIRYTLYAIFLVPAFWATLEYARSNLFTGFGWALLGHSQYLNLSFIQISDITGAYGVSFFVMAVNVIIYILIEMDIKKSGQAFIIFLILVSCVAGYGFFKLNAHESPKGSIKISLIQGNIPQYMKWDPDMRDHIWSRYSVLTEMAAKDRPDLIIWPETSLPGYMEDEDLFKEVAAIARRTRSAILIGAPSYREEDDSIYNAAFLIDSNGDIVERYDKLHLVPFGEYIPFDKQIGFIRKFVNKPIGEFEKGKEHTVFELEETARFSVLICFEDIFADLVRRFANRDVDFLVNITNDAWFMKTPAPYQHAQSSVFRAVENRLPVVRAANTGLSCFIDRTGRIFDSVNIGGNEICITGFKTARVDIMEGGSLYTKIGDIFVFLCALAAAVAIIGAKKKL